MSKVNDIKKVMRLQAIQTERDKENDTKTMIVYEVVNFKIQQKTRTVSKVYYNKLKTVSYTYTNGYNEIALYNKLLLEYQAITPFQVYIDMVGSKEYSNLLVEYYNQENEKYFEKACKSGQYQDYKIKLGQIKANIKSIDDLKLLHGVDFILNV